MTNQIKINLKVRLLTAIAFMSGVSPALAHHPMGGQTPETFAQGLLSGLGHPLIGVDHFLFLVVTGVLTFALRPPIRYLVPGVFVVSALLGTALHIAELGIPLTEIVIALTVIIGGALVVTQRRVMITGLSLLFAGAGVFHGYAYAELIIGAEPTPLFAYLLGFSLIQYAVITGISIGFQKLADLTTQTVLTRTQLVTGSTALAGGLIFLTINLV